jgi:hypothetical protein
MDNDLPPPPYSRWVSTAVFLDQDDSFVRRIDKLSSSIREVTAALDAVMLDVIRDQALNGSLFEALNEWKQVSSGFELLNMV